MDFALRRLGANDVPAYRALRSFALGESPRAFSDAAEDVDDDDAIDLGATAEHFTLGAFHEEALVGIVTAVRDPRTKARHRLAISTMYVAPAARRQGLAQRLVAEVVEAAKAMTGVEQIRLWVLDPSASTARRVYARLGFASWAVIPRDLVIDGAHVDAEYMVMTLA